MGQRLFVCAPILWTNNDITWIYLIGEFALVSRGVVVVRMPWQVQGGNYLTGGLECIKMYVKLPKVTFWQGAYNF